MTLRAQISQNSNTFADSRFGGTYELGDVLFRKVDTNKEISLSLSDLNVWLRGQADVRLAGRDLAHLDTLLSEAIHQMPHKQGSAYHNLGECGGKLLRLDAGQDHAAITVLPVDWCGNLVVRSELEGIKHAQNLAAIIDVKNQVHAADAQEQNKLEVAASGGGIENGKLQLLVGSNNENLEQISSGDLIQVTTKQKTVPFNRKIPSKSEEQQKPWVTNCTGSERETSSILLIRVDHAECHGQVARWVGDDGVREIPACLAKRLDALHV